jgi:hypothetical protein
MMGYGGSHGGAGIKIRGSDQIPQKYSSSSERRESFLCYIEYLIPILPRFPGKRETPKSQALPTTLSTWTLVDHEVHSGEPRPDPPRQDTQDVVDPVPHDLLVGNPRPPKPVPQTCPVDGQKVTTPGGPKLQTPGAATWSQKENPPPQVQSNSSQSRQPMGKFRKFIKSASVVLQIWE